MWRTLSRNADVAVLAVAACFGLGLSAVWAAHGFTWSSGDEPHVAVKAPAAHVRPRPEPRPVKVTPRRHRAPTLTLVAARGPAWVSIRSGVPAGRTLYEGLLRPRKRITFNGPSFVARFQASGNLDAIVQGRRTDLVPFELRRVMITKAGIRLLGTPLRPTGTPAVIAS